MKEPKPAFFTGMLTRLYSIFLLLSFLHSSTSEAQKTTTILNNRYGLQYGFSLKATIELGFTKSQPNPLLRLAGSAGIASDFLCRNIYPSLNTELQLYNGGFGSSSVNSFFHPKLTLDGLLALTLTAGLKDHLAKDFQTSLKERNTPLYFFADFSRPSLVNPFDYSLSAGTNLLFTGDKTKKNQRIGFLNVHIANFQLSYYNDGGVPISGIYLGDRADRYYTGGGVVGYHLPSKYFLSDIQLSYHKFTGYSKSAFEVSNELYLDYMNYHDTTQKAYNKSLWSFTLSNNENGLEFNYKNYNNVAWDLQHRIHTVIFNAFHLVPYDQHSSISVSKYYIQNHIGTK